jgi:hypothetical protein
VREMEEPGLRAWWSSAVAVQAEAANHPELLRLSAVVVSVVGNVAPLSAAGVDHEGERKQTTDDVSKEKGDIETGDASELREEPGGCLSTGQAVSGIEVARAWSGLSCGRCEPVAPRPRAASGAVLARGRSWKREPQAAETARGRVVMRGTGAGRLVVAGEPGNAGGAKGTGRPGLLGGQPLLAGGAG